MRTVLLFATLTLAAAAAARAQQRPPARPSQGATPGQPATAGEKKGPAAGEAGTPATPGAPEQKVGEAPTIPTGQTAAEAAAAVPETGTIARINVQGNRRVETDAIRAAMPMKPGDSYDREKLKAALLAVWKMGYFNDVKLDVSAAKPPLSGYTLTVLVSEKPAVREIKLEGNEELSKDDFKETIEVKPFQILDQQAVRKSARKMQEKYVEKGFFLAEVTPKVVPLPNNEVNVIFQVTEHAKITRKEVRFVGNRAASASMLKDAMLTQEGSPFSFLTGAGTYREDAFQRDEIVLQGLYFDMGYIYVKFGKPAIELSPDKRYIFITMTIEEGDPFDVGKIDVSGDLLRPKQELLAMIETRPGDRF